MNPEFLDIEDVLEIHTVQLTRFGGSAGIRDQGLLESGLAQPKATFGRKYLHSDLSEMAAAYLFHIVSNHPFVDGNKRTGLICALTFLDINGIAIQAEEPEIEGIVLEVAKSKSEKASVADFFRRHIQK